jgi:Flp pilus assembly protein protease CpaA
VFWSFSLPIIISDLATKKIPNIYLKLLVAPTSMFILISGIGPTVNLIFATIVLSIFILIGVGMGDVKLLALAFMIFNSQMGFSIARYLFVLLGCAVVHICIDTIGRRRLTERIALAPSIFLAFALYLSAR